jgi:alkaline phosphatase
MAITILPDFSGFSKALVRDAYFLTQLGATDSASAATAIATGYKTDDGNIAWLPGDPANGSLTTIAEQLRANNGFSIGVVSTVPFNHATPAGFVSHNISRNNYAPGNLDSKNPMPSGYRSNIAEEILLDVKPEVVIGGGFNSNYTKGLDLTKLPTDYVIVQRQAGVDGGGSLYLAATSVDVNAGEKLFGLFGEPGGNFDYHVVADTPGTPTITRGSIENPTLTDAVNSTLTVLSKDPQGFFVMFEQGDIDWSNHSNDFENMIGGVWDLDQSVRAAEAYVDRAGDINLAIEDIA